MADRVVRVQVSRQDALLAMGGKRVWHCAAAGLMNAPCNLRHGWEPVDNPKCRWIWVVEDKEENDG